MGCRGAENTRGAYTLTDEAHDHPDELALIGEPLAVLLVAGQGVLQILSRRLVGIVPLFVLVASEGGALSGLLGFLHGETVGGFTVEPALWTTPRLVSWERTQPARAGALRWRAGREQIRA